MITRFVASVALTAGFALSAGCGGGKKATADPYTPDRVASLQGTLKYHKILLNQFAVDESVEEPGDAPADCEKATTEFLTQKGVFTSVQPNEGVAADPDTLIVETTVVALRIVDDTERLLAGVLAGTSHMTLRVVAKDASGAVVGDRVVSNENSSFNAAWSLGASDRGLPADMGPLVADAIVQLAQSPSTAPSATK
jgi:hypothetical protein